ncbi:class I SAM-dependent methyltransferase [Isoalcanivorax indicus]|uniref:class I SAM-dependent methyltransferase n=1 Tax=Isoalcanivorax indicus TaxID=2202653 RepID=UPI000DB958CA|nr:methyltransferase domain-containing protein [Isoalcanivorax indicus]
MFDQYADIFERRGAQYTAAMAQCPQARRVEFEQALITARVGNAACHLLDVPAGGAWLRDMIPGGPVGHEVRYTAVESTDGFIQRLAPDARPALVLAEDLTRIPLPDACADRLVSLAGLHHIEQRGPVYSEMRRLMKPGAVACIADVQAGTPTALFLNGPVDQFCPMGHHGLFLDDADTGLLRQAGWHIQEDQLLDVAWRFASLAEMGSFCRLLFGLDNAPDDEAVIEAVVAGPGVSTEGDQVLMHWPLRFICVTVD